MASTRFTDEQLNSELNHAASFLAQHLRTGGPGFRVSHHLPCDKIGRLVALARLRYGAEVVDTAIAEKQANLDAVEQGGCPLCNGTLVSEKTVFCREHKEIVDAPRVDISDKL